MPPFWHWAFSMPDGGESFLPRIQSVFYAVFDVRHGPKIVYQVPEGLIASSGIVQNTFSASPSVPPTPTAEVPSPTPLLPSNTPSTPSNNDTSSRASSSSLVSPSESRTTNRNISSSRAKSSSTQRTLFNFDDIHKYVIPPSALCGRLVICSTQNHRIIGLPVALNGKNYERNYFRYNLCFVFDRNADLSCYEPIVRKVSRVLTACEEESHFLSSPSKSTAIYGILEQLYEDLNSYAETSIPIDQFNSIELKIFPFYPNPPPVKDWMVPLALINLAKRVEDNWDLTMVKVCKYIDGVNHVARIAYLADCDIALTRQAISHLLYYQVIMTIDIFQYSNMYTLRKSIQWLADETHVKEECGPYVTKPGKPIPDWPKLLHLYSRLKPGKTLYEWMEEYEVEKLGIDIHRFTSFGVIKGFLRRVHRWPVYVPPTISQMQTQVQNQLQGTYAGGSFDLAALGMNLSMNPLVRKRGHSMSNFLPLNGSIPNTGPIASIGSGTQAGPMPANTMPYRSRPHTASGPSPRFPFPSNTNTKPSPEQSMAPGGSNSSAMVPGAIPVSTLALFQSGQTPMSTLRSRRVSAAEKILEQLRNRDLHQQQKSVQMQAQAQGVAYASPRNSWIHFQQGESDPVFGTGIVGQGIASNSVAAGGSANVTPTSTNGYQDTLSRSTGASAAKRRSERRQSLVSPAVPPPSPVMSKTTLPTTTTPTTAGGPGVGLGLGVHTHSRPRLSRSPSATQIQGHGYGHSHAQSQTTLEYPPQLVPLLDGEHHTDELCVRFEVGWPLLEHWLEKIGGGELGSEQGRVVVIYR